MNKKRSIFTSKILELIFYAAIQYFSYYISFKLDLFSGYTSRNYVAFHNTIPWFLLVSVIAMLSMGLLRSVNKSKLENVFLVFITVVLTNLLYMAIAFLGRDFAMPRTVLLLGAVIQFILFLVVKFFFISVIIYCKDQRDIILLCGEESKSSLVVKILSKKIKKEHLKYCIDPSICKDYMDYVRKCEKIYISDSVDSDIKNRIVLHCISNNKSLYIIPKTFEIAVFNSSLIQVSDVPVFKVESFHLPAEKLFIKRVVDIFVSLVVLILVSPLLLLVSLVLLITQGRPIFFVQERVTKGNKIFKLYKFRSMRVDAEKYTGPIWATKNDPRVTAVGRFLRRYWIDELPQLFNVLKGDMSLVGPRPERPIFTEEFSKTIPDFKYRLSVKAGVTGLAQVLGRYATSPEIKIKYDLIYIRNSSFFYDIKIMVETAKKILVGTLKRGEYVELDYKNALEAGRYKEKSENGITEYNKAI